MMFGFQSSLGGILLSPWTFWPPYRCIFPKCFEGRMSTPRGTSPTAQHASQALLTSLNWTSPSSPSSATQQQAASTCRKSCLRLISSLRKTEAISPVLPWPGRPWESSWQQHYPCPSRCRKVPSSAGTLGPLSQSGKMTQCCPLCLPEGFLHLLRASLNPQEASSHQSSERC